MDQIIQSYVADHRFMGAALVARGDQVVFNQAYGSANLEWNVPNTPATKFRLGSVTKQFTAASILLLEERGKLNVNDPLKKYMPDAPAAWDKVTIFHLLTHTSGVPSFTSLPDYPKIEPFATTPARLIALFRDQPMDFEPGEKWLYDNSGYVLLTYVIEKITGDTYEKFVRENIFAPLGMTDSGYDSNSAIIPRRASGYSPGRGGVENAGFIHMTVPQGAGALYSTTGDLLKWEQGLFGGKVLKPASVEKMITPFKNNYAFGLGVETAGGHKKISHGGGIEGFNTQLSYYPDDKLTVVVLANLNGPVGDIADKLAAVARGETVTLTGERKEITLDSNVLRRYLGAYQMPDGGPAMLIALDGSQLTAKLGGQPAVPIFPQSETMFFLKVVDAQIEFPKDDGSGKAGQLTLHQNGRDMTAKRLDDAEAKKLADAAAAFAKRLKDQTPAPGSEQAANKMIRDLYNASPDPAMMSPGAPIQQQLARLQKEVAGFGAVEKIAFQGVGPGGADIYSVKSAKGSWEFRIWLMPDGKVQQANTRPVQ
ncbi:MAG TPA: serine hydrolase [Bryobacteraceae bacterium]|nr:serine hydrolase [Bryobacteraceae bacterium]